MDIEQRLKALERVVDVLSRKRIGQQDIIPGSIKQRHITGIVLFVGTAANRPASGSTEQQAYFATDTNALSFWNGTAWKSVTLT